MTTSKKKREGKFESIIHFYFVRNASTIFTQNGVGKNLINAFVYDLDVIPLCIMTIRFESKRILVYGPITKRKRRKKKENQSHCVKRITTKSSQQGVKEYQIIYHLHFTTPASSNPRPNDPPPQKRSKPLSRQM